MKSDAQIQLDIAAELKFEPSVNATQIGVTVSEGVVTLFGKLIIIWKKYMLKKPHNGSVVSRDWQWKLR